MGTVKQTITDALREIVVLTEGDEATADMIESAKDTLQSMIALWSIEGLMVPYLTKETFTLDNQTQTYNWASGQSSPHFNSVSPVRINAGTFVIANYRRPLEQVDSRLLAQRPIGGRIAQPIMFYFDRQAIPTVTFDCVPYGGSVEFITEKPLDATLELTDTWTFPAHYDLLLRYNLAILLAPPYGKTITPELAFNGKRTLETVTRYNAQPVPTLKTTVPSQRRRFMPITLR